MKTLARWLAIPVTLAIAVGTAETALSQIIAITTSSSPIQLSGTSGGSKKDTSCAGYTAPSANHTIQVVEDSNLSFTLQSSGQPALLIRGESGEFCVPATSDSGGQVTIPGRWTKGKYSIYVGDRANGHNPYTLSIVRN